MLDITRKINIVDTYSFLILQTKGHVDIRVFTALVIILKLWSFTA